MFLAKDIMTSPTISVSKDHTVKEALDLLAKHSISGLPVVDAEEKVIGIISGTDIMRYSQQKKVVPLTSGSFWVSPYTESDDIANIRRGFETLHRTIIEMVMTKKVYSVSEDTATTEVARLMNRRKINRVPVVNETGKLVGIVTRADIVKCMADTER